MRDPLFSSASSCRFLVCCCFFPVSTFLDLHFMYLYDYLMQHEMTSSRFVRRSIQCALWASVCCAAMLCYVVLCVLYFFGVSRIILTLSLLENPPLIFIRFIILFPHFIQYAIGACMCVGVRISFLKLYHNDFFVDQCGAADDIEREGESWGQCFHYRRIIIAKPSRNWKEWKKLAFNR